MTSQVSALQPLKLVAYLRVSTDRQADQGLGLDVQRATIRAWAREHGHKLVQWSSDQGVSGANGLDSRVGLPEALQAVVGGKADGIVVYRLDRLARDLVLQEELLAEVKRANGQVYSCSAGEASYLTDDPDDPSRTLIRQVIGAINSYERSMIRLRLRSGRALKARRGGYAYGAPPFGYSAAGGELVKDKKEQKALALIATMDAAGHSIREIIEALETKGHKPKRGERWHPETVRRVLARQRAGGARRQRPGA